MLLWPRLKLGVTASLVAFWSTLYGPLAILVAYTTAAIWGVGIQTIALMGELPHGLTQGTPMQETTIQALAFSSVPPALISFALILWGLRVGAAPRATEADDRSGNRLCPCSARGAELPIGNRYPQFNSSPPLTPQICYVNVIYIHKRG